MNELYNNLSSFKTIEKQYVWNLMFISNKEKLIPLVLCIRYFCESNIVFIWFNKDLNSFNFFFVHYMGLGCFWALFSSNNAMTCNRNGTI